MGTCTNRDDTANSILPDLAFSSCSIQDANQSNTPSGGRRRQVMVKGRRVKTIDIHAHCLFTEALALSTARPADTLRFPQQVDRIPERLRTMDEQGIDMEAISINPFWYREKRDVAARIVEIQNEKLAELCASHADRFVAFASVALQFPDLAIAQLETAIRKQGLRGVAVGSSVAGAEFCDPRFHPFWAKCEELGILVFIHPASTPQLAERFKGSGWLANIIGNPVDTTIALTHLIFEGTLDRFPGLKICAAHGGGYLPSYAARSDAVLHVRPELMTVALKKKPTEYLKTMYFDSLVFTPEALRHLVAEVGAAQIMLGTDHPIPWQPAGIDHILNTADLGDDERAAILGDTAARLLGIA